MKNTFFSQENTTPSPDPEMAEERNRIRKAGIAARDGLTEDERLSMSAAAAAGIAASPQFRSAGTVLIYREAGGELSLAALEAAPESEGKRFAFPRCVGKGELEVFVPRGEDAMEKGRYGIMEPVPLRSQRLEPEEIDMVLCPCAAFDEGGGRMGMGGGYYDRYLPKCVNAFVAAVAFEAQKTQSVPAEPWDIPVEAVFTEAGVYHRDRTR